MIATELGLHQSRISCFCNGRFSRASKGLKRLCAFLDVIPHTVPVTFEPSKHKELIETLNVVLDGNPANERAVLSLLRNAAKLRGIR